MSQNLEELPLFPVDTVLLPYQADSLSILDERFQAMVRLCIAGDQPFGIVLNRSGAEATECEIAPYMVGTTARVIDWSIGADGRIHVVALGERRFRIRRVDHSNAYPVGYVEPVVELEWDETRAHNALLDRAKEAYRMHVSALLGRNVQIRFTDDPVALSFAIAGCIHLSHLEKQHLLEITDTAERIKEIIPMLESQAIEAIGTSRSGVFDEVDEFFSPN